VSAAAALIAASYLREGELRIGRGHLKSQRVAARAGFKLVGPVQHVMECTGEVCEDLRYVYASARTT
jgi:RimJ/RimL family protein N-acetyltransferase